MYPLFLTVTDNDHFMNACSNSCSDTVNGGGLSYILEVIVLTTDGDGRSYILEVYLYWQYMVVGFLIY